MDAVELNKRIENLQMASAGMVLSCAALNKDLGEIHALVATVLNEAADLESQLRASFASITAFDKLQVSVNNAIDSLVIMAEALKGMADE